MGKLVKSIIYGFLKKKKKKKSQQPTEGKIRELHLSDASPNVDPCRIPCSEFHSASAGALLLSQRLGLAGVATSNGKGRFHTLYLPPKMYLSIHQSPSLLPAAYCYSQFSAVDKRFQTATVTLEPLHSEAWAFLHANPPAVNWQLRASPPVVSDLSSQDSNGKSLIEIHRLDQGVN